MMQNKTELFSSISSVVSSTKELISSLTLFDNMQATDMEYQKMLEEIKSLYSKCRDLETCSPAAENSDDPLENITDGRFESILNRKVDILDMDEKAMAKTLRDIEFARSHLEIIRSDFKAVDKIPVEAVRRKDAEDANVTLEKCVKSLNKLKSNFDHVEINEELRNSERDAKFESNMTQVISLISDLSQFLGTRKTIDTLSDMSTIDKPPTTSALFTAISDLLEEAENVNGVKDGE